MEKKVYQIRYAIKDKDTKRVKVRRIDNVMAIDLKDAEEILKEKWFAFDIKILDVLNEWSLEGYIIEKDSRNAYGDLFYKTIE